MTSTDLPDNEENTLANEQPWDRLEGEPLQWYHRFLLFRDIGPNRKIRKAFVTDYERTYPNSGKEPPKTTNHWFARAQEYRWIERAAAWDDYRRKEVFTQGSASELNRIARLDKLIDKLEERINKGIENSKEPKGLSFELVDLYLKALEAQAKETGGRIQRKELTGAGGSPVNVLLYLPELEDLEGDE